MARKGWALAARFTCDEPETVYSAENDNDNGGVNMYVDNNDEDIITLDIIDVTGKKYKIISAVN